MGDLNRTNIRCAGPTFRQNFIAQGVAAPVVSLTWFVWGYPRARVWTNQTTSVGAGATVQIDFAIRDSSAPGTPEWLLWDILTMVPGGLTPVKATVDMGAVWLRFTILGTATDHVQIAGSAFL